MTSARHKYFVILSSWKFHTKRLRTHGKWLAGNVLGSYDIWLQDDPRDALALVPVSTASSQG
jgi:hypothetical protein